MNALLDYLRAFGDRAKELGTEPQNYLAGLLQSLPDRNSLQGAVKDPEFYKGLLGNTKEMAGGLLTGALGAPVDIATMMMRPGGYNVPDRNVVGSSNHLAGLLGLDAESTPYKVGSLLPTDAGDAAKYMGLLGQVAWHGSPHKFAPHPSNPLGKFDLSKMGSGEGGQAYGHGAYLGEARETGEYYRRVLSKSETGGHLYKVDVADDAVPKMLDWDKPLSKQSAEVRQGLSAIARSDEQLLEKFKELASRDATADQAYALLTEHAVKQKKYEGMRKGIPEDVARPSIEYGQQFASSILRQHGIPGIRYLDSGSRGKGGTSNFVLFDEDIAKILDRE